MEYKAQTKVSIVDCHRKQEIYTGGMQEDMCLILNEPIRFEPHTDQSADVHGKLTRRIFLSL